MVQSPYVELNRRTALLIILSVSLLTRFIYFGHPDQTVFDEVHFGKFISGYYTHQYYFDIHPPLGKLIIAGFGKLFDFKPEFSFANIGEKFPDKKYMALRFLPTLASVILPLILFLLALELGFSNWASLTVGLLVALENAILVQSRLILLDSFLLLFGFTALLFYFRHLNGRSVKNLIGVGIFGALATSVKWTGLTFLALPGLIELWIAVKYRQWPRLAPTFLSLLILPMIIYFSVFAVHFSLLTKSGPGDAFMSPGFQKTLTGNLYNNDAKVKPTGLFGKFIDLNNQMYLSNKRLTASHAYGSQWYTWPFMTRPIYYWVDQNARIYLLGNPLIWWASTVAFVVLLMLVAFDIIFDDHAHLKKDRIAWILLIGYFLNLLPFIGIKRVMFLYHYLTALVFAILILVYTIDKLTKYPKKWLIGLSIAALVFFVYFAPLTYGLSMSPRFYEQHVWLKSWK